MGGRLSFCEKYIHNSQISYFSLVLLYKLCVPRVYYYYYFVFIHSLWIMAFWNFIFFVILIPRVTCTLGCFWFSYIVYWLWLFWNFLFLVIFTPQVRAPSDIFLVFIYNLLIAVFWNFVFLIIIISWVMCTQWCFFGFHT